MILIHQVSFTSFTTTTKNEQEFNDNKSYLKNSLLLHSQEKGSRKMKYEPRVEIFYWNCIFDIIIKYLI